MATHQTREQRSAPHFRVAAIDTSSDRAGLALFDGHDVTMLAWNAHRNHTVDTLAQFDRLLHLAGLELQQIDGYAVATGPGSFSALRVGLSIGKGLAFSMSAPLVGVPTTDAIAAHLAWIDRPVIAVMTAGRGRVVWSRYVGCRHIEGPNNTTLETLQAEAQEAGALIASDIPLSLEVESLVLAAGARVEQVARIGWARLRAGDFDDPALLEPIYAHGQRQRKAMPA